MRDRTGINFSWLLKLRWGAVVGQTAIILGVHWGMGIALPLTSLGALIGIEALSNLACAAWLRGREEVSEWVLWCVMALDVVLLTGLLYLTGGAANPFSFLYLVHIALAAVVLRARWTWPLVALSAACFGVLFSGPHHHALMHDMGLHVRGMWVAFGVASAFIVYFVQRVTRALAQRDDELTHARSVTARHEKLAALATLAAGAAHELSTPLSTIAVIAKELERLLVSTGAQSNAVADAKLIREQVERCRSILAQMAADAGESAGEPLAEWTVGHLLDAASAGLGAEIPVSVSVNEAARTRRLRIPPRAVTAALRGVLKNAQQASPAGECVWVEVRDSGTSCEFQVRDAGTGMTPEVLARAGEPFFSTKGPGQGMGLGLFLTRTVLERLGGTLELSSRPGQGTTAVLSLPGLEAR